MSRAVETLRPSPSPCKNSYLARRRRLRAKNLPSQHCPLLNVSASTPITAAAAGPVPRHVKPESKRRAWDDVLPPLDLSLI
jgi:hypothetical protein